MTKTDRRYIHAVNADGDRKIIPNPYWPSQEADPDDSEGYFFDVDWYLDHGYMTLEEMFADIESSNPKN